MTSEPTRLAQKVADAVAELAACLATGVRIDPGRVIAPLMASMGPLHNIAGDLGRTAVSVDEEAAAAAQRAGEHFLRARGELGRAMARLPMESPRGTLYGRPRQPDGVD
jgi:hypothetical protein